uniref:Serum amyloid A protein n=2 Tax=Amphiprion percula TaxID=161767 RepID=A0A3P8TDX5_AMPPE
MSGVTELKGEGQGVTVPGTGGPVGVLHGGTSTTMKLLVAGLVLLLIVEINAEWYTFPIEAVQGAWDMAQAYRDMRKANWKDSDKYFHARGNYEAAQRGAGGRWAAEVISDAREWSNGKSGGAGDTEEDQEANRWGREGGDPNRYRPAGLPDNY